MIYILTGNIESGKSSVLLKWIEGRTDVFGILSPINNFNERYFLDISKQESFTMEAKNGDYPVIYIGRYCFLKSAFKKANAIIKDAVNTKESGFILIDEIGKLELRSEGLHKSTELAIQKVKNNSNLHAILVIRKTLLDAIIEKYNIEKPEFVTIKELSETHI